jgi:hypothetical protein
MLKSNGSNLPVERKLLVFEDIPPACDAVLKHHKIFLIDPSAANSWQALGNGMLEETKLRGRAASSQPAI